MGSMEQTVITELKELRAQNDEMLRQMDAFYKLLEANLQPRKRPQNATLRASLDATGRSNSAPLEVIEETVAQASEVPGVSGSFTGVELLAAAPPPQRRGTSSGSLGSDLHRPPVTDVQSNLSGAPGQRSIASRHPTLGSEAAAAKPKSFDVQGFHEAVLRSLVYVRRSEAQEEALQPATFEPVLPGEVDPASQGDQVVEEPMALPPASGATPQAAEELQHLAEALAQLAPVQSEPRNPGSEPVSPALSSMVQGPSTLAAAGRIHSYVSPVSSGLLTPQGTVQHNAKSGEQPGNPKPRRTKVAWSEQVESVEGGRPAPSQGDAPRTGLALAKSSRSSIDDMRRHVEVEIVRNASMCNVNEVLDETHESQRTVRAWLLGEAVSRVARGSQWALHAGGLLPWSAEHFWKSICYQWAVFLLHLGILCGLAVQTRFSASTGVTEPFLVGDLVLAGGCVTGFVATGAAVGSVKLQEILLELKESNRQHSFVEVVDSGNAIDTMLTIFTWLVFLSDRLGAVHMLSYQGLAKLSMAEWLRVAAVFLASAQLAILVLLVLRVIRNMTGLVNGFCLKFLEGMDYTTAPPTWNKVQASLRLASSAVERTFASLLSILVLLALAIAFDLQPLHGVPWALTASGGLILMMSQVLLRAAAVTDACIRISQLVNATGVSEEPMDVDRKYLVEYITASAAGFYVFNVRLGAGLAIKVFHYTGLMVFTLARLVLPSNSQF